MESARRNERIRDGWAENGRRTKHTPPFVGSIHVERCRYRRPLPVVQSAESDVRRQYVAVIELADPEKIHPWVRK